MANVVFWSGGEDSTLAAIKLLRAGELRRYGYLDYTIHSGDKL